MNCRITMAAAASMLWLMGCQRSVPEKPAIKTPAPPVQVAPSPAAVATEEIGHFAENLYDWGRQQDWTKAQADLITLQGAVARLNATGHVTDLHARLGMIEQAVQGHQARALMHAANEMTRAAAEISRQFNPPVPAEVALLDFYGRELALWSEEKNVARLNETRTELTKIWNAVRSEVISRGGSTEAGQFDALVEQLTNAKTAKDFGAAAKPILDTVDALENVFTRTPVARLRGSSQDRVLGSRRSSRPAHPEVG